MSALSATRHRRIVFWAVLALFVSWDLLHSEPIDIWSEPPLLAPGSGQSAAGGHCALPR